jgi:GrpB-like predicted nucleotidyltransferase (UPF0157 family)
VIEIVDYDPEWPRLFEGAAARLRAAAPSLIVAVEHIGSTAVPGLAAKPIVDLMPAVATGRLDDLDRCVEPFVALGYEYIAKYEDELPYRRFFKLRAADRQHNVHLVERGSEFWVRHRAFRDILRTHPPVAADYADLKCSLALRYDDVGPYTDAKTGFIESTLAALGPSGTPR